MVNFRFVAVILPLLAFALTAAAGSSSAREHWIVKSVPTLTELTVKSSTQNGVAVEVVKLPNGDSFSLNAGTDQPAATDSGLTAGQIEESREAARETLELTLRAALSDDFNGLMDISPAGSAVVEPEGIGQQERKNILKRMFAFNNDAYKPFPKNSSALARVKRFGQVVWQFVIVETLHAGADYYKAMKSASPRFNEYGLAIDLKIEPQVFLAKFNPTSKVRALSRNYAFFLEISYSRATHRLRLTTRLRREKGAGGLGLPALKAELKVFETDGYQHAYKGKAWYPVSPPLVSFVLDSSEHYFAQGITIGINSGDLIPGSTLTNTFTTFVQGQDSISVQDVPHRAGEALSKAALRFHPHGPMSCSMIFG